MRYITTALALATLLYDTATTEQSNAAGGDAPAAAKKSIVPAKYSGKYKGGGSDELATFINEQCTGKDGFEFTAFFQLCRANGLDEAKIAHYESQVNAKISGAAGRARMTLRNMMATFARKNGELVGLDGNKHAVNIAKPAVSGAAAKAQETAQASAGDTAEGAADSTVEEDADASDTADSEGDDE